MRVLPQPGNRTLLAAGICLWLAVGGCAQTRKSVSQSPAGMPEPPPTSPAALLEQHKAGPAQPKFIAGPRPPLDTTGVQLPAPAPPLQTRASARPQLLSPSVVPVAAPVPLPPPVPAAHNLGLVAATLGVFPPVAGWNAGLALAAGTVQAPTPPQPSISTSQGMEDVRTVLGRFARFNKMNIVLSPGVMGQVATNFVNLTPEQELEAILKMAGLVAQRQGNVLYVYTPEELNQGVGGDMLISTRFYRLNYIRAVDLQQLLRPFLTESLGQITNTPQSQVGIPTGTQIAGAAPTGAVTPTGIGPTSPNVPLAGGSTPPGGASATGGDSLAINEVVVVRDRESRLREFDNLVAQLDVPPPQVLIEAVIVSVDLHKDQALGVNFAILDSAGRLATVVGNGATLNAALNFNPDSVLAATPNGTQLRGTATAGFAANEPGLKFGFKNGNVAAFVRALESIGKTEILATPRVLVLNKQPAELLIGNRLGYRTFSQSLVSTIENVQFLDTGTLLRVRPFISTDGLIRMEIHPERSSGQIVNDVPQSQTTELTSNLIVPDGATVVIGGLIEHVDDKQQRGVPWLGTLPGIGALFRERTHSIIRRELVVLLTARIWTPTAVSRVDQVPAAAVLGAGAAGCPAPAAVRPTPRPPSCLGVSVRQLTESVRAGQEVVYEVLVTNQAPNVVEGMLLNMSLTPGLFLVGAEGPTAHQIEDHRAVSQPLTRLEPRQAVTYRVRARAGQAGRERLAVQAWCSASPEAVQVETETQIQPGPAATLGPPSAVPGESPAPPQK